jgi:GAF domain-containing protein
MTDPDTLQTQLRRLLLALEATERVVAPGTSLELLQSIVEAAARIFGAAAASIALVDEEAQELVFRVAYNVADGGVVGMRIPIDQGIAGYVAMSGQPLALSDVQNNALFNQSFAQSTGYVPNSILAMPLQQGERVIGVIEVLDKLNASAFGLEDMELLGLFARQAALAIHEAQQHEHLSAALVAGLRELLDPETAAAASELLDTMASAASHSEAEREVIELARMFTDLAQLGEAERDLCRQVLTAFGDYARGRSRFP